MNAQLLTTKSSNADNRDAVINGQELLNNDLSRVYLERSLQQQGQQLLTNDENGDLLFTASGTEKKDIPVLSVLPRFNQTRFEDKFIALQRWEGYVTHREEDKLYVHLTDLTNGGTDEEAEFSLQEDIDPTDRILAQPGAIFYWSIGHETRNGTRQKTSVIKFKRAVLRDADTIIEDRTKSLALKSKINWE